MKDSIEKRKNAGLLKKIISVVSVICILTSFCTSVFAQEDEITFKKVTDSTTIVADDGSGKFADITKKTHAWAIDAVNAMTEKGIINGTSETTFSPDDQVTKIQALLLISRMLGYNDTVIQKNINSIYSVYEEKLSELSTVYKKELAFLAFSGAFTIEDIAEINFDETLTRQQAALFLANADKASLDSYTIKSSSLYADNDSISSDYDKAVYYVSEKGYMNGVGDNKFSPDTTVTRAQIATMLYRILQKLNVTYATANVDSVNASSKTVNVFISGKTYELGKDVAYRNKGEAVDIKELYQNLYCIVTSVDGVMTQCDAFFEPAVVASTVDGKITYLPPTETGVQITDVSTDEQTTYKWADRYSIIIKGDDGVLSQLRKNDYAVLSLNKAKEIITLEVMDTDEEMTDLTIKEIVISSQTAHLVVKDKEDEEYTYEITSAASIRKNGSEAEFSTLGEGDKISKLSLSYNRVKSIDAYSEITSTKGTISTIHLAASQNYIVLANGTSESTFNLNKNTQIFVYGEEKTVYDLELDQYASVTLDGTSVAKVEVAAAASTATNIIGTVLAVNTTANIISVQTADGTIVVYISTKATSATKIIDNNATAATTSRTLKDIKEGATITAIGASEAGYFTATTVVYSNK